ncbi:histone-fold-containing protein [Linnemannia elongata AG-77]|uniref:Histone-fold-containing protein n=1 Tax=Linnemannia elongata AG-77 TaxID=1314771 RepID=A0A197KHA3_9FUNG|nr:histone-fold-containing protein [Linnemannia elongata AG-77]
MYDTYHQQAAAAAAQASNSSRSNINNEAADTADSVPAAAATGAANTTLHRQQLQFAQEFWEEQIVAAEQYDSDFKNHPLPLARIKKVMKSDPEVKMISAEAPILFSKACEIFICEITRRAWLHAEENKRRTLQRSDVANAVSRSDQFDFLIDIVPREEPAKPSHKKSSTREDVAPEVGTTRTGCPESKWKPCY